MRSSILVSTLLVLAAPVRGQGSEERPDQSSERELSDIEERGRFHFAVCDADTNGWISYREANAALGIEKEEYRELDTSGDGRLSSREFRRRYPRILQLFAARGAELVDEEASVPTEPESKLPLDPSKRAQEPLFPTVDPDAPTFPFPTPADLLAAFDRDASDGLSEGEVANALAATGSRLSIDVLFTRTDRDETDELELAELGPLSFFVAKRLPERLAPEAVADLAPLVTGSLGVETEAEERPSNPPPSAPELAALDVPAPESAGPERSTPNSAAPKIGAPEPAAPENRAPENPVAVPSTPAGTTTDPRVESAAESPAGREPDSVSTAEPEPSPPAVNDEAPRRVIEPSVPPREEVARSAPPDELPEPTRTAPPDLPVFETPAPTTEESPKKKRRGRRKRRRERKAEESAPSSSGLLVSRPFAKLDANGNGSIDAWDLERLLAPARSAVRINAVISALDGDGDGALSAAEFERALGGR